MVGRVLMIAFHYPPQHGSSGVQRTLKFSRYLPEFGWQPTVITAHPRAHASVSDEQLREIPPSVTVHRSWALDAARHLALRGRYLIGCALPDRWSSWWLGAVPTALAIIFRQRPEVLWSTYPIATAHWIACTVHRLTGVPWVADFRDPMTDEVTPSDPRMRRVYGWIERAAVRHAAMLVFSTPGIARDMLARFPTLTAERVCVIENGYDEENFAAVEQAMPGARTNAESASMPGRGSTFPSGTGLRSVAAPPSALAEAREHPLLLLHSGIIYPSERDPGPLFEAIATLKAAGVVHPARVRIVLRAAVHEDHLRQLIDRHAIGDIVQLAPPIPYAQALREMLDADGLLILQAANCNSQIPAKLYEYLRARRPILALTDAAGDTARKVREADAGFIAALDSATAIIEMLPRFLRALEDGSAPAPSDATVAAATRRERSRELAAVLSAVAGLALPIAATPPT